MVKVIPKRLKVMLILFITFSVLILTLVLSGLYQTRSHGFRPTKRVQKLPFPLPALLKTTASFSALHSALHSAEQIIGYDLCALARGWLLCYETLLW
jgi:hypothetical protein